jgi:hypothetical protein
MLCKRSAGAGNGPGEPRWFALETRLVLHILGVVTLVAASLAAMADQSGRLVGVHELPPFVTEPRCASAGLSLGPASAR